MNVMAARWSRLYRGTDAELALEDAVAALGVPYRTQFPGWMYGVRYFVDYLLPTLDLVIEVDDESHNRADKRADDEERTRTLEAAWGVRVVRCTNEEALADPHGTVRGLLSSVGLWPLPTHMKPVSRALPKQRRAPRKKEKNGLRTPARSRNRPSDRPRGRTKGHRSAHEDQGGRQDARDR